MTSKKLRIKKRRPQGGIRLGLTISLLMGSLPMGLFGDVVTFSASEGYVSGESLGDHPNWKTKSAMTIDSSNGKVNVLDSTANEAVYSQGELAKAGDIYTAQIDFGFTETNANSTRSVINVSLYASNSPYTERIKIGLVRNSKGSYNIKVQKTYSVTNSVVHSGGESLTSAEVDASSIGIIRNANLETDPLRLVIEATRGVGQSEWKITGELWNISVGSGTLVGVINATGVTFSTSDTIYGGFGNGYGQAGVSERAVHAFEFSREDRSYPFVTPSTAAGGALIDLNGNGLSDQVELLDSINASLSSIKDSDGDGVSDGRELLAGTDSSDPGSVLRSENFSLADVLSGGDVEFTFSSVAGVKYRVEHSSSLEAGTWTTWNIGTPSNVIEATGPSTTVNVSFNGLEPENCFFRAKVVDSPDFDGDGLVDSLELYLGFDPKDANSVRNEASGGDFAQFARLMSGSSASGGDFSGTTAGVPSEEQTSRFLAQATFGPNDELIRYVRSLGDNAFEKWIDEQFSIPATLTETYLSYLADRLQADLDDITPDPSLAYPYNVNKNVPHFVRLEFQWIHMENFYTAWMRQALFAPDKLRQRVAWSLSQIFAVSPGARRGYSSGVFYDRLILGLSGTYEELLMDIAISPYMGAYLSSLGNQKADPSVGRMPDENFAREVMQLFSIGLWELNMDGTRRLDENNEPIPTYTIDDVVQMARVFTGLDYSVPGDRPARFHPMKMIQGRHDVGDGVSEDVYGFRNKRFFVDSQQYSEQTINSGQPGMQDIEEAIKILVKHPSCAPFISKNLIQHMVTSNPSPAYVERVANVFNQEVGGFRGDLKSVIKAILMDPEARSLHYQLTDESGRLKDPMLRLTSLAKAFRAGENTPALYDDTGIHYYNRANAATMMEAFAQFPLATPSVFNFYEPGYSAPGIIEDNNLVSPEFQILNSLTSVKMPNKFLTYINTHFHNNTFAIDTADFEADLENDIEVFLNRLNMLLCHGRMHENVRSLIRTALQEMSNRPISERVETAIYLILTSPDAAILR